MFSPVVAEVAKILDPQESKSYIVNEGSEEDTVVAGGPVVRNGIIIVSIRNQYVEWKRNSTQAQTRKIKC